MLNLRMLIRRLNSEVVAALENSLINSKADNFLALLRAYQNDDADDNLIQEKLGITANSYYVLKSRLYDRIQEHLSGDVHAGKEEVLRLIHTIPEKCFTEPREVATAFLEKLEKDLLYYDMHHELLPVYSALKKISLFSDSYFHYSQMYNRHIAFSLSLEKAEEILGAFVVALSQYDFSRSPKLLENLVFLGQKIDDYYVLNPSRQTRLVKQMVMVQMDIFCNVRNPETTEELLRSLRQHLSELPESSSFKRWEPVIDYLCFEYYFAAGQDALADTYYEKVKANEATLCLYSNLCMTSRFFISKVRFLQIRGRTEDLKNSSVAGIISDPSDIHTQVLLGIYTAMNFFYKNQFKEAAVTLNSLLNINSFRDYFHINAEIKLSLAYLYILQDEDDVAANILRNLSRKIRSDTQGEYQHALDLMKLFQTVQKPDSEALKLKQRDLYTLFTARNNNSRTRLLLHLEHELQNRYNFKT
jgi:hypothetical protein